MWLRSHKEFSLKKRLIIPIDNVFLLCNNARPRTSIENKGNNHPIQADNFTTSSILTRFSTFRLSSLWLHQRRSKSQTLYQWQGSENCCFEAAQRTVNKILRGKDTCSHSKVEYWYREKQWLCWEVGMRSTEEQLHLMSDTYSCVSNYFFTKKRHYFFTHSRIYIYIYMQYNILYFKYKIR